MINILLFILLIIIAILIVINICCIININKSIINGGMETDSTVVNPIHSISDAYGILVELLQLSLVDELSDDKWDYRYQSKFLRTFNLYNWGKLENRPYLYFYTKIYDLSTIDHSSPMESIARFRHLYIKQLEELKRNITYEHKFCALYGAPIAFRDNIEPHAYKIYKDMNSDVLYTYNGRGNVVLVDGKDLVNEHIEYSWGVDNIQVSPIDIPIQSYADGLICSPEGVITKDKTYQGLCFPVVVICAYLFMQCNTCTFSDVVNYLHTKSPDQLSELFLKMNNYLGQIDEDDWF
jgi:hypothetical protein